MQGILAITLINLLVITTSTLAADPKIDAALLAQLQNGGKASMIIEMRDSTKKVTDDFATRTFSSREERLNALNQELRNFTQNSQKSVVEFLEKEKASRGGFTYEPLYITNTIIVKQGDLKLAQDLAKFQEIAKVGEDKMVFIG